MRLNPLLTTIKKECLVCGGDDASAPCAYPGERMQGCLRDVRLETEDFMEIEIIRKSEDGLRRRIVHMYLRASDMAVRVYADFDEERKTKRHPWKVSTSSGSSRPKPDDIIAEAVKKFRDSITPEHALAFARAAVKYEE
jgi:hypothetical protein